MLGELAELEGRHVTVVVSQLTAPDDEASAAPLAVMRGTLGSVEFDQGELDGGEARGLAFVPFATDEVLGDDDPVGRAGLVLDGTRFAGAYRVEEPAQVLLIFIGVVQLQVQGW